MKKQNGITLVALITTIAIIVILAGITIKNIKGDGTIRRAENTATTYDITTAEADLKMAVTQCLSLYGKLENLADFLDDKIWTITKSFDTEVMYNATTKEGYSFKIKKDGTIELQKSVLGIL